MQCGSSGVCVPFIQIPISQFMFRKSSVPLFVIPDDDPGLDKEVNEFENPAMKIISELSLRDCFSHLTQSVFA